MSDRGAALREYRKRANAKLHRVMKNWYKAEPRDLIEKMADMMAEDQLTAFEAGKDHERQGMIELLRQLRPHVMMSKSTTSGRDFQDNCDRLVGLINEKVNQ